MINLVHALFVLFLAACNVAEAPPHSLAVSSPVVVQPLPREDIEAGLVTASNVELVGGWQLSSDDPRFGGFSALTVFDDRLFFLSDRGTLWSAGLGFSTMPPVEAGSWNIRTLRYRGRSPDAEALAVDASGILVLALESDRVLARLRPFDGNTAAELASMPLPEALRGLPSNRGVEALAALPGGSLLALAEDAQGQRHRATIIDSLSSRELWYRGAEGFAPTGADQIDSHLVVLERRLSLLEGFCARVVLVNLQSSADPPDEIVAGGELIVLRGIGIADNMEGIALQSTHECDVYRIWLISDDNFSPLQRTLLFAFNWRP